MDYTEDDIMDDAMPNWQQRVYQERVELEYALRRLNRFIESEEGYPTITSKEKALLERQQTLMEQLYEVLGRRICNFEV